MCHQLKTNTDTTADVSDPAMQTLMDKIEGATLTMKEDNKNSRYCRMKFLNDHFGVAGGHEPVGHLKVESVVLRASSVFKIMDTGREEDSGYRMVLNRDRVWNGHNSESDPDARHCGVSVYHKDWDYIMKQLDHAGTKHTWRAGLDDFFPGSFRDFYAFVNEVGRVLTLAELDVANK